MSSRWHELAGDDAGADYAARMDAHLADGDDVHGEADLVEGLLSGGGRVLDAGCGTGRVAIELARRGLDVVGVDLDASMLTVARERGTDVTWHLANLARLDVPGAPFDLVVAAGNVVPLLADGSEPAAVAAMAAHLVKDGLLVAGFGLDVEHLPLDHVPVTLDDYDGWCDAAGLELFARWATWDRDPFPAGHTMPVYAVSVHRRPRRAPRS